MVSWSALDLIAADNAMWRGNGGFSMPSSFHSLILQASCKASLPGSVVQGSEEFVVSISLSSLGPRP